MNRLLKTAAVFSLCIALAVPVADSRGRIDRSESPSRTHQPQSRPGNNGHNRPGHNSNRPGNNNNRPDHNRPGHNNNRPGNNHNRPDHNRPGGNHHHHRPGNPGGALGGGRPDYRPGHHHHDNRHHHGPMRPNLPPHHHWHCPPPPPHWRPSPHWRPFRSILGITFGTALNISVNALIQNGYVVNSYGQNTIYVSNASMLNLMWPDAVLYYNNAGGLCGSRFIYSSGFYDMNRYNMAYASLVNGYGAPVSVQNTSLGVEATWWGTGNQFIRLAFEPEYTDDGSLRYFTTLSFGN